jgi:hypothetical protein
MLRHCQCRLNHPLLAAAVAALVCLHLLQVADAVLIFLNFSFFS